MTAIRFGTSGWRAIVADEFTFANVRRAVGGIARYVRRNHPAGNAAILVGRDPRFLGEQFVAAAAAVLRAYGLNPIVVPEPAPTPAISLAVRSTGAAGAINFTASHNPPEYNGIKFSTPNGAPALPEVTHAIEAEIAAHENANAPAPPAVEASGIPAALDVRQPYLQRIAELVDLPVIRRAGLRVAFDPLWGAARGYPDALLREHGIAVQTVHDQRDVLFGGHAPEPDDHLLDALRRSMRAMQAHIGIATDGDADRFGIVDADGTFIQPNYIIALLFDYLVETRNWRNGVAKSVATTNLINALARHHGVELHETPVGFKYVGELIERDAVAIGGEESAGLSIRYHVPEKDGIVAGLLCCEMVARRGQSISAQLRTVFGKVGSFYPLRENFRLTPEVKHKFTAKMDEVSSGRPLPHFFGRAVCEVVRTDGLKLLFDDGSWVCYRLSGTEPVVRVYSEARTPEGLRQLSADAKRWIFE
ncbi:MAG: phosphoglucomutase/phosphomannomutase family protein [Acidobacteria bacterium]|nr:phosphoglucomutase/phosphomannomutase family protein [Acidobacteriota bacterium]